MPRLPNKGFTGRAPQTAGSVPELPDFNPQLAELPGATETNAAYQRWWDLVRQRIEFNNAGTAKRFFEVKAEFTSGDSSLSAEIVEERIVRADADSALAFDILTVSATVDGLSATVTTLSSALATAQGYLEARWTLNVTAGFITTGMTLFSASGPDTDVSYIAFQADRFQINTASGGNKMLFSATATEVKLGDVLTVDLLNRKMFIGTGTYANTNTAFYVDAGGNLSLGAKLAFNYGAGTLVIDGSGVFTGTITASAGAIGGWTIGATTLTGGNATLSSTGVLILGTSNDVVYISAADATYRLWVGNATAASAAFSVTKAGALFATGATISGAITSTSGTIGGFTIGATSFSSGSGATRFILDANSATVTVGTLLSTNAVRMQSTGFDIVNSAGTAIAQLVATTFGQLVLGAGGAAVITLNASSGTVSATAFAGSGASLTSLNASNISSGTLGNTYLPTAISVTTLSASNGLTIGGTEVITSGRSLNSSSVNLAVSSGVKSNLLFDAHAGADVAFAGYMKIFANGGTVYVPYTIVAP